jgi:phosphoglycolate phosphatase-like HAD superfamily hydrolase
VPGIIDFLDGYHQRLPLYVASGTPHEELNQIFTDRSLNRFFKGVYGSPPAKTELLSSIVNAAGLEPSNVLMVGDSSTDMEAAENAGTLFYGRGDRFADSKWPWGLDLQGLVDYVESSCLLIVSPLSY